MTTLEPKLVLVVRDEYQEHDIVGPFDTVEEAQGFAEGFRVARGLPAEATAENNDTWTEAGWYFGIHPLLHPAVTK